MFLLPHKYLLHFCETFSIFVVLPSKCHVHLPVYISIFNQTVILCLSFWFFWLETLHKQNHMQYDYISSKICLDRHCIAKLICIKHRNDKADINQIYGFLTLTLLGLWHLPLLLWRIDISWWTGSKSQLPKLLLETDNISNLTNQDSLGGT